MLFDVGGFILNYCFINGGDQIKKKKTYVNVLKLIIIAWFCRKNLINTKRQLCMWDNTKKNYSIILRFFFCLVYIW